MTQLRSSSNYRDEDLADLMSVRETMQSLLIDDCKYRSLSVAFLFLTFSKLDNSKVFYLHAPKLVRLSVCSSYVLET